MSKLLSLFCNSLKKSSLLLVGACAFAGVALHSLNAHAETLAVKVAGFRGTAGNLQVMVWKDSEGFPTEPEKAVARKVVPVTASRMEVTFTGLPRGNYAVAAFHDVNGNGKLDRSLLGWPTEPVGASNGATSLVGPPKFRDAVFELKPTLGSIELTLK
jgi:uncharacterized protein (DUF2141 family)